MESEKKTRQKNWDDKDQRFQGILKKNKIMNWIDSIANYFIKSNEEIEKDILNYIKNKDWYNFNKSANKINWYPERLSDENKFLMLDNMIEDKIQEISSYLKLLDIIPREKFIEYAKKIFEILEKEKLRKLLYKKQNDLSYHYVSWLMDLELIDFSTIYNSYYNSREIEIDKDYFIYLKGKIDFYSIWNIIHFSKVEDFIKIFTEEEVINGFKEHELNYVWNDGLMSIINDDNILFFIKQYKGDLNLIKLIEKLDILDCDNIENYYLVRNIIQCNPSSDVVVKLLNKTNLEKKEQRDLLKNSIKNCDLNY